MSSRRTRKAFITIVSAVVVLTALASASSAAAETFLSGYVTNGESSSLTKFNATTNQVDEQVEDQLEEPGQIAINADATKAYVGETCNEIEPNHGTVVESEVPSFGLSQSIQLSTEGCASAIAISPKADVGDSGETVWVVDGDAVFPIDSADDSVGRPIIPPDPCPSSGCVGAEILQSVNDIAISPDGNTLYMLYTEEVLEGEHCQECGDDTSVDDQLIAFEVGGATAVPGQPVTGAIGQGKSLAISADGRKAFTTTTSCHIDQICINALDSYSLEPDPAFLTSQTFSLTEAGQILLDPNGRWAWVAQTPGTLFLGESIETFELETGPPYEDEDREFDENDPIALAVSPDAKSLYVGFHDRESIAALETEGQGEVEIPVGEGPVGGIAITPAQAPEAKLEVHAGGEAEPTYFDASGSQITCNSAECSEIVKYEWNFGDGNEETTTGPTTQHTYLGSGPFTATVTETSSDGVSTEPLYNGHVMLENGGPQARATQIVTLPTLATQASAPTVRGGTISDTATLAEGEGLGGAVEFQLWGPGAPNCEGSPLETWTVPVSGDGEYSSGQYTANEVGTYQWTASYTNADADPALSGSCGDANESVTVGKAQPTISTSATPGVVLGGQVGDVATVVGGDGATGTVTFELFEPGDTFCTGTPVYTHTGQLGEEFAEPEVVRSAAFTPTRAGKYRWIASYSGDAQNEPASDSCGEPGESTTIAKVTPTITTQASPAVGLGGGLLSDTATISGGHEASGRVVFALYGPADPACQHTALFSVSVPLSPGGTATSSGFAPASVGEYHWIATYVGDTNNEGVAGSCGDPNESVSVGKASSGFETKADGPVTIGAGISDTATLSGATNPSGTIAFSLFGPDDPTCATVLYRTTVAVHGDGSFAAEPFVPTAPGEYRWVAEYSGDADNEADVGHCGDPGETSTVAKATPTLGVSTTGSVGLGGALAATATVSGGDQPSGSVSFQLFAPGDTACTGAPVFTATVPLSSAGAAASGAFTPLAAGTYAWRAAYSGDADNSAVAGPCGSSSTVDAPPAGQPPAQPSSPAPEADLRVKLSAPGRGTIGKSLVYRVTVANDGDATAHSVELTNRFSGARIEITASKGAGCKGDRAVTCKLGSLAPGKDVRIEITVRAKAAGRLTLTSAVDTAGGDAKAGNDRAAGTIAIDAGHRNRH
jgi:Domain of unknown function DUF11/PKD domain